MRRRRLRYTVNLRFKRHQVRHRRYEAHTGGNTADCNCQHRAVLNRLRANDQRFTGLNRTDLKHVFCGIHTRTVNTSQAFACVIVSNRGWHARLSPESQGSLTKQPGKCLVVRGLCTPASTRRTFMYTASVRATGSTNTLRSSCSARCGTVTLACSAPEGNRLSVEVMDEVGGGTSLGPWLWMWQWAGEIGGRL